MNEMNEMAKLGVLERKLDGICDKNNLVHKFRYDKYPITLTIRPAGGMEEQMTMLENADKGNYISPNATLTLAYQDGELVFHTVNTFTIKDDLYSKIKNIFKEMNRLYCQYVHRVDVQRGLRLSDIEVVDDDDSADDKLLDDFEVDVDEQDETE